MKKILLSFLMLCFTSIAFAQNNDPAYCILAKFSLNPEQLEHDLPLARLPRLIYLRLSNEKSPEKVLAETKYKVSKATIELHRGDEVIFSQEVGHEKFDTKTIKAKAQSGDIIIIKITHSQQLVDNEWKEYETSPLTFEVNIF